jgi:putative ABC transport system permease protein
LNMTGLLQDVRFALRQLRKSPGFFVVAALTLAIAIGANSAIFSVVNAFLVKKPRVPDPDRLLVISSINVAQRGSDRSPVSTPDFLDWRAQATSFDGMAAANFDDFTLSNDQNPQRVAGARVSPEFFEVMGVAPALGRSIMPGESDAVAVISDALWRNRFGGARTVLGYSIKVDGVPHTVVGVMPASFRNWEFIADIWVPLKFSPQDLVPTSRNSRSLIVFARLKPDIGLARANQEMSAIAQRISAAHSDTNKNWGTDVLSLQQHSLADGDIRRSLLFLTGTVGFVLLIACANVACLLLSRSAARTQEFVTRAVLGASRVRLARQLLSECLCLSLAAAGFGILFAMWGVSIIRSHLNWSPDAVAWAKEIFIDPNVLFFTLAIATLAASFFGLFPAFQIASRSPAGGLSAASRWATSGRKQHRLQKGLVVSQLALSLVLFVGAGLFVEGFIEEMRARTGFNENNVLTASVALRGPAYEGSAQRQTAFFVNALDDLRGNPQVESAAVTDTLPFNFPSQADFTIEASSGKLEQKAKSGQVLVGAGYFSTLQLPVLEGREFAPSDDAHASPVAVVNRAFVRRYFGNTDPIGHHIRVDRDAKTNGQWSEIVGVVGDVNEFLGQQAPRPHIYEPFLAHPESAMKLVVRTRTRPENLAGELRNDVSAIDRDQAVTDLRTMRRVINDSGGGDDLMSGLMSTFALIALIMAAIGTYGVLSYAVSQRTKEMGIRMAVGANPGQVRRMVIRNGAALSGIGILLGVSASLVLPKLMASVFSGFGFHSALVITAAPITVLIIALTACYIPARRAAKVDPMVALRYE